jgi:glutamate dehydrogenase (NAD(P)+)
MYQGRTVAEIVTGKPVSAGGTEGRREATGRGIAHLVDRALDRIGARAQGSTAIVQGFGNVGGVTAQALAERGMRVIGVSDHSAAYYYPGGLNLSDVQKYVVAKGALHGFSNELLIDPNELIERPCDILVPAAVERVITHENAGKLKCRILAEGANGPTTPEADRILEQRRHEIFVLPDILCNAGGVIVSYFEWVQGLQQLFWSESEVLSRLYGLLDRTFDQVMARSDCDHISHRTAALAIGVERVRDAKRTRGLFP